MIRPGFDKAFVVGFNRHSQMTQDFTDNVRRLLAGVHTLHDGGGTALYDADLQRLQGETPAKTVLTIPFARPSSS